MNDPTIPAATPPPAAPAASPVTTVTVPLQLEVSIRLRTPGASSAVAVAATSASLVRPPTPARDENGATEGLEAINFDADYDDRTGYDPDFLDVPVPLPTLTDAGMKLVSRDRTRDAADNHFLHYHHFSVVMNKRRRLAFFVACNTSRDPALLGGKSRKELSASEPWRPDPRIPVTHQITTNEFYKGTVFDRGHLVRREDAYWGADENEQDFGNFDSFHYTNCSPQHRDYNRSNKDGVWGKLENWIAEQSKAKDLRFSLVSGPVLAARDPVLHDVRVPRAFWKLVLSVDEDTETLGAWAFLLSQAQLVAAAVEEAVFDAGEFERYQIPVAKLHELTEVRFPDVVLAADTFGKKKKKARAVDGEAVAEAAAE